jgi:hypothetical protein
VSWIEHDPGDAEPHRDQVARCQPVDDAGSRSGERQRGAKGENAAREITPGIRPGVEREATWNGGERGHL